MVNFEPPGQFERASDKQAEYRAEAEKSREAEYRAEGEEAREAGYKSPLRRLIERILPSRRGDDLPVQDGAGGDAPPGQFRQL